MTIGYSRYVALGDSQTEGLLDGDDNTGIHGFADRLAWRLNALQPGLHYANLAVRGRRISDVLDRQLPLARDMNPDLITSCIGMNDVTRPVRSFDKALEDMRRVHTELAATGATVVTTTFPDIARILPVGRVLSGRLRRINEVIRTDSAHFGFRLVDLSAATSMLDPATWAVDRVHGSPHGHQLFADAAAEALGLPGSDHRWAEVEGDLVLPRLRERMYSQLMWAQNMLMPWVWRHTLGSSRGKGLEPKRPVMAPLDASPALSEAE
ncbi:MULTISPECIES: SGNH/GDSL hydrolase family protein [Mycolicibacterium]|uniref:SGNH/GDSL hydrolase family protein n=1 Tax=Mycolicibacterium TaxID=1866885 RepID=UPI0009E95F19|nr:MULTISPECIES: SGNH/GDSL hydrolase family protein [Mycolicibacterium]GCA97487.1 lysophospholipase [Mycolicibacterium sp. NCC-Tsukiji]